MDHDLQSGFYRDHHVEGVFLGPAAGWSEWAKQTLLLPRKPANGSNSDSAGRRYFSDDVENDAVIPFPSRQARLPDASSPASAQCKTCMIRYR